jgi:hypothetical protein
MSAPLRSRADHKVMQIVDAANEIAIGAGQMTVTSSWVFAIDGKHHGRWRLAVGVKSNCSKAKRTNRIIVPVGHARGTMMSSARDNPQATGSGDRFFLELRALQPRTSVGRRPYAPNRSREAAELIAAFCQSMSRRAGGAGINRRRVVVRPSERICQWRPVFYQLVLSTLFKIR